MTDTALRTMVANTVNENRDQDAPPEVLVESLMKIIESVHENALGYGQLVGEERVLDALIEGRLPKASQRHWWDTTKQKIKAAQG